MIRFLQLLACAAARGKRSCAAQAWPSKPLRVVVAFTPGSATDMHGAHARAEAAARRSSVSR